MSDNKQQEKKTEECPLSGLTIMRFAHAFSSGAGVEQYLDDLDKILLFRNTVTLIRLFLVEPEESTQKSVEALGKGILVKIPLKVVHAGKELTVRTKEEKITARSFLKNIVRDWFLFNPILYRFFFHSLLKKRSATEKGLEVINMSEEAGKLFQEYKIDLLVMHHLGGRDSSEIVAEAERKKIPFVFQNHFTNKRFNDLSIREQVSGASGYAGVSTVELPRRLKKKFINLSDGVDTVVFSPDSARYINITLDAPGIILPARFSPVKGQDVLIRVAALLRQQGVSVKLILAGRSDSGKYIEHLKDLVKRHNLVDDVLFVGALTKEELRDWYNLSSLLVFPVLEREGLGRVLLEAQAMKVPPVSYISGGTKAAMINGRTGFLVRQGDIHGLVERAGEILSDEPKRIKMGEEGRQFVLDNFSLDEMAKKHERFYLEGIQRFRSK